MFRKRSFWIALVILFIAVGAGGYYYTTVIAADGDETTEAEVQTAVARTGEIVVSATGAGTVIANDTVTVGFQSSGTLAAQLVQVGEEVQAGDLLARLDDADAQRALANAQLQLEQAALQVDPDTVATNVALAEVDVAQAEINMATAQADLDELLNWEVDDLEVELAQANLDAAEGKYAEAATIDSMADDSITQARVNLERAQESLASAQEAYATAYDPGREWELNFNDQTKSALERERSSAESALTRAEQELAIAQASYNLATASLNYNDTLSAKSSVVNAQITLEEALTGPTAEEIAAAELAVDQAEVALQQARLNLETVQNNIQAEISYTQAEINLAEAEAALAATELAAPIAGTVTGFAASPGESVSGGLVTLANLSRPVLEVYLDESDMVNVAEGYEVEVVFDAMPDETFTGTVVQVDPELVNEGGVTAVRTLVQLDPDSFARPQTLPIGMNATVEVIGGRAENAVIAPVEALRELSPGEYAVFVMENGEPVLRSVEVGLMDFSFAEIISGLEAGEEVTTGIVQTQ